MWLYVACAINAGLWGSKGYFWEVFLELELGATDSHLAVCRAGEKLSDEPGWFVRGARAPQVMLCQHGEVRHGVRPLSFSQVGIGLPSALSRARGSHPTTAVLQQTGDTAPYPPRARL